MRYGVLLSGGGRTLENLLQASDDGRMPGRVEVVISSRPNVRGVEIAVEHGIPVFVIDRRSFASDDAFSLAIWDAIEPFAPHLVLLAGFLRKVIVTAGWTGRVLNIHPALLPDAAFASGKGYYGNRVHEAVLRAGLANSGATVHIVDNEYDTGPVVMTKTVPVLPDDDVEALANRVYQAECSLYPRAIASYVAEHRVWLDDGRLPVRDIETTRQLDKMTETSY